VVSGCGVKSFQKKIKGKFYALILWRYQSLIYQQYQAYSFHQQLLKLFIDVPNLFFNNQNLIKIISSIFEAYILSYFENFLLYDFWNLFPLTGPSKDKKFSSFSLNRIYSNKHSVLCYTQGQQKLLKIQSYLRTSQK